MAGTPSFSIPARPERQYSRTGGLEYVGQTMFQLVPDQSLSNEELGALVAEILADGPYRYGDFLNLPMILYLVRDERTGDVFRLSIRDGRIRLHVLPETESDGLRGVYNRVVERTECEWRVECETTS